NMAQGADVRRSALIIDKTGTAELTATTDLNQSPQVPAAGGGRATGDLYEPNAPGRRDGPVTGSMVTHFMAEAAAEARSGRALDGHIADFCSDAYLATPCATA